MAYNYNSIVVAQSQLLTALNVLPKSASVGNLVTEAKTAADVVSLLVDLASGRSDEGQASGLGGALSRFLNTHHTTSLRGKLQFYFFDVA